MEDVIEYFLPIPGAESAGRGRRIGNFTSNLQVREECGGTPIPLDLVQSTNESTYPELDMIREWGLPPIYSPAERYGLDMEDYEVGGEGTDGACLKRLWEEDRAKGIDSVSGVDFEGVVDKLALPWQEDQELTTRSDPRVQPLRVAMAQCLREGSGLAVSDEDPSTSFLKGVDRAYILVPEPERVSAETVMEWSVLYADCGEPYYAKVKELLEEVRPAWVERNREVIENFAAKLVELGYVP
ncbi:hypothetical protein [Nocardioides nitrophenolicus]|uniref:hypothetical protein n=1 Tax=Nocardioides nitrophenolicus TaxID=60489 RepID=UPI000AB6B93F|nr:hypothetical protein [Nocardioides nitrophenolicus]MBM7518956.1 hypothetical protein [Nocardioides nitrophenolicus]